jgi:hypothetical protein
VTDETFEVEIDQARPWHMREELFKALTDRTKMEIAEEWKRLGMELPSRAELNALPDEQRAELMRVVNGWLIWAGHKPVGVGGGKPSRTLEIERDGNGRLMKATEYSHE